MSAPCTLTDGVDARLRADGSRCSEPDWIRHRHVSGHEAAAFVEASRAVVSEHHADHQFVDPRLRRAWRRPRRVGGADSDATELVIDDKREHLGAARADHEVVIGAPSPYPRIARQW
jgi:hypothetical protein